MGHDLCPRIREQPVSGHMVAVVVRVDDELHR